MENTPFSMLMKHLKILIKYKALKEIPDNFKAEIVLATSSDHNAANQKFTFKKTQSFKNPKNSSGTSLVVQWLRLHSSTGQGTGSIPGQGTKISCCMAWPNNSNNKNPKQQIQVANTEGYKQVMRMYHGKTGRTGGNDFRFLSTYG